MYVYKPQELDQTWQPQKRARMLLPKSAAHQFPMKITTRGALQADQ